MARVAFLGLGVMGYPMAGHLAREHQVTVYNRTAEVAQRWLAEHLGEAANTPAQACESADFVLACVGADDDVRAVTTGPDGAFSAMREKTVFIDHTTASSQLALELDEAASAAGYAFLDAPVSGGEAGAQRGELTVMCGGKPEIFHKAQPVMNCYARRCTLIGPTGHGQLAKMINQICIAGLEQGLAEGLHFGQRAGLDMEKVIQAISQGAAGSWQMENRYQTMLDGNYEHGFAVDWMRKDLGLVLEAAEENATSLPVTALVDQFYKDVQQMNGGRWDTSALLARLKAR